MVVEKNGVKFTLNSQTQIDAFLSDGYTEVKGKAVENTATQPTVKTEEKPKKTVKKATK